MASVLGGVALAVLAFAVVTTLLSDQPFLTNLAWGAVFGAVYIGVQTLLARRAGRSLREHVLGRRRR